MNNESFERMRTREENKMNVVMCGIGVLILVIVVGTAEVTAKKEKIKIIIPHKISYVHHHYRLTHSENKIKNLESKKKFYFKPYEEQKGEDESEEDERRYNGYDGYEEEDEDGSEEESGESHHEGISHYAIPASKETKAAANFVIKPVYLYNRKFKYPSSNGFVRYGDYDLRGKHFLEDDDDDYYHQPYSKFNFHYK